MVDNNKTVIETNHLAKRSFLKDAISYSGTNVISQGIAFVRGFIIRRLLPPEMMGIWNFAQVVQGVIATFDLGTISAAGRELPILRGQKDAEEELKVRSTTLWFSSLQFLIVGLGVLCYAWWNRASYSNWQMASFYVAAFLSICGTFFVNYTTFFQSAQYYVALSRLLLFMSFVELAAYSACTYFWGLYGLFAAVVGTTALKSGYFVWIGFANGLRIRIKIYSEHIKKLLYFGFPLRLVDYPNAYFKMADLLWVTRFMDIEALALYSTARTFLLQVSDISVRVGTVFETSLLQHFGNGASWELLGERIRRFLVVQLLVVVPLITWASATALPFLVRQLIPKYSSANEAMIILLLGNFFVVINSGLTNPWFIQKRLVARGVSNVAGLAGMALSLAVTWYVFGRRTIIDVSYASLAGYILYFVYMVLAVGKELWGWRGAIEVLGYVLPAAAWTGYVLLKGNSMLTNSMSFWADLRLTTLIGFYTLVAIAPIILLGVKKSNISGIRLKG